MRILTILFITSVLIVFEVRSKRLFKRDDINDATYPTNQPPTKSCGNCEKMVFEIKCGGEYKSEECYGCKLLCDCKDDKPPSPSPSPSPPPPTTNPTSPPLDETYPPPGPSPTDQTYPSPTDQTYPSPT